VSDAQQFWNSRYAGDDYTYGTDPNDFLVEALAGENIGRAFSLGEGEGRNAVWLAERGGEVASIDASDRGVAKTLELAESRGVQVAAQRGFLEDLKLADGRYDTIISIFAHTDPDLRRRLHRQAVDALAPGGVLVIEAYSPRQLTHGTGGPRDERLLVTVEDFREELVGLQFEILHEIERDVIEGTLHTGRAAVVQCKARKPL